MTRPYRLGKRAEAQQATRQRIVEAAVELHGTVGPAATTVSQIAERAGVQRHTFYAHFPQEADLVRACSGHFAATNPLPDPEPWAAIGDPAARLREGLSALYAWFGRNAGMVGAVLRDAEVHPVTRAAAEASFVPAFRRMGEVLGDGLGPERLPLLRLALDFHAWRTLAASGLDPEAAAALMARAILGAAPG